MLTLSKQSDYALIIISQLMKSDKEYVPLSKLVEDTNLPQRFLARIAAILVAKKILISREGRIGGYKIADSVKTISLYEFLSYFEHQLDFLSCMKSEYTCRYEKVCHHRHGVLGKLNQIVLTQLKKTKLIDLF